MAPKGRGKVKTRSLQPDGCRALLNEAVGAGTEEFEKAEVAEDLELLADFVADVGVVGMEFCQSGGVSVNVGKSEFEFAQRLDYLEHVESPAAFFYLQFFQRPEPIVRDSHFLRSLWRSFVHYRDAGVHGNLVQQNIAANPTGAASRRSEGLAALDSG